jgi:signal transduction histidine kinase
MKKYDILLVDDEEDVANAMRDALLILDFYNPTIALSGNIALDMASKKSYDAFLVDQIMPIMPGTEFIKKLIEIVDDPLIYIVTAEDDGIALDAAELFPAKGGIPVKRYIQKPWQPSLFTIDLREDLRERDLKRSLLQTLKLHSSEQKEIQEELNRAQNGFAQIEKRDAAMSAGMAVIRAVNHEVNNINAGLSACMSRLDDFFKTVAQKLTDEENITIGKISTMQESLSVRLMEYTVFITSLFTKTIEHKKIVQLSDLVSKSVLDIVNEMDCSLITIEKNIPDDINYECYPQQMRHAFYQIIKNGIEAMPEGGILSINAEKKDGMILIVIRDSGKGIPEKNISMIFVPLITHTKIYGGKGGVIAHKIITDNHNGTITVKSLTVEAVVSLDSSQVGTTITISLPI